MGLRPSVARPRFGQAWAAGEIGVLSSLLLSLPLAVTGGSLDQPGQPGFEVVFLIAELSTPFVVGFGKRETLSLDLGDSVADGFDLSGQALIHHRLLSSANADGAAFTRLGHGGKPRTVLPHGMISALDYCDGVVSKSPQDPEGSGSGKPSPDEVDDQFRAIMEGLRTSIPGVMVLFSFLLILPLQASFGDLSGANTVIFYVAFTSAAISAVLLIAPSVHQRVRAPITGIKRRSWRHVMYATKLAIAGTVSFLIAIAAVVYLVSSLVFSDPFAVAATLIIGVIAGWSWFYLPLVQFSRE